MTRRLPQIQSQWRGLDCPPPVDYDACRSVSIMPNPQQCIPIEIHNPRIVLLGKTGAGKSAAGNTILGQKVFRSAMRMNAVTSECSENRAIVSDRSVSVVDTPGFFDTQMKPDELITEIARSVYLSSPGPHAFLIVLRVCDRFTEQEQKILQMIETLFCQEVLKYSIILFTRGDELEDKTVEELIEENGDLKHLVDRCGGRYHVFNNKDINNREQVNDLLQKIDTMIELNGGGHYSNQMYEDAQRLRQEEEEIMQRLEEEKRRQRLEDEERRQRQEDEERRQRREKEERRQRREKEEITQRREKEERRQREKERNKQPERVRKEKGGQPETNSGFQLFLLNYKEHIYKATMAAGFVVGGAVGGAVVYGAIGGTIAVGAVSGGVVGAVVGRTKSGTVTGAFCGAAVGAAVGAGAVGAALSGPVANAVGVGAVSGAAVGGAVGGASSRDLKGFAAGALAGAVVGGTAFGGAGLGAALSGTVGGASVCGAVAGGAVGGAAIGGAVRRSVDEALNKGVAVGKAVACGTAVGAATTRVVDKAVLDAVVGGATVEVVRTSAVGLAVVGLHCHSQQVHLKEK